MRTHLGCLAQAWWIASKKRCFSPVKMQSGGGRVGHRRLHCKTHEERGGDSSQRLSQGKCCRACWHDGMPGRPCGSVAVSCTFSLSFKRTKCVCVRWGKFSPVSEAHLSKSRFWGCDAGTSSHLPSVHLPFCWGFVGCCTDKAELWQLGLALHVLSPNPLSPGTISQFLQKLLKNPASPFGGARAQSAETLARRGTVAWSGAEWWHVAAPAAKSQRWMSWDGGSGWSCRICSVPNVAVRCDLCSAQSKVESHRYGREMLRGNENLRSLGVSEEPLYWNKMTILKVRQKNKVNSEAYCRVRGFTNPWNYTCHSNLVFIQTVFCFVLNC